MKNDYIAMTESALFDFLPDPGCREAKLIESMRYSLEAGGKRVRPRLVFEFNALCGGDLLAHPRRPSLHGRRRSQARKAL